MKNEDYFFAVCKKDFKFKTEKVSVERYKTYKCRKRAFDFSTGILIWFDNGDSVWDTTKTSTYFNGWYHMKIEDFEDCFFTIQELRKFKLDLINDI